MEASRITIRPFRPSDADDFHSWASDARLSRYLRWAPLSTQQESLHYLHHVAIPALWRRSICLDGRSVGYVSVKPGLEDHARCRATLSYAVGYEHCGRWVCTAALRAAIPAALQAFPDVGRLEALVDAENLASQRVLEKVGFTREGLLRKYGYCNGEIRDMFIYSFLSSDEIK